jgi:hypothetical protein
VCPSYIYDTLCLKVKGQCGHSTVHEGIIILFTEDHKIRIPVCSEIVLNNLGCEINLL